MTESDWRNRIVCDPELHHGEPCVRGARIPIAILVTSLAASTTPPVDVFLSRANHGVFIGSQT